MAETMVTEQLRRQTRSEDLITTRRYGYVEQGNKDYLDVKTKSRPTRSEDLYRNRRFGYAEAATAERRPSPIISKSEWLQAHKRYGYVEKDQTDDIFSTENREDHLIPQQILKIMDKIIDEIISRENKTDHQTNTAMPETKADTMMFPQLPRPINARSEDLHTRRRYGYVEQGNGGYLVVTTKPRPSRSEDLHKSRRCGYVEENTEERRLSSISSKSQWLQTHRRCGYVEKDQTDEIIRRGNRNNRLTPQQIREIIDKIIDDLCSRENEKDLLTNKEMQEIKEAAPRSSIKYLIWRAKYYEHFHYVYNLVRDCRSRVEKLLKQNDLAYPMPKDVIVKIGIVGDYTEDNVKLISERPGKSQLSENQFIWEALPLVCFESESSSKSKLKENALRQERACHKIFITSDTFCDKTDKDEDGNDNFIIVGQNKDQIEKIITSCLEEPLHTMLQKWSEDLKRVCFWENASDIIAEIEAIRKKLVPYNSIDIDLSSTGTDSIVPGNLKNYLLRRSDVNSFGIWSTSAFKVFVKKATNVKELKNELITLNKSFFEKYHLEIEFKIWREMQTLKQGDSIQSKDAAIGTIGGFVTNTNNDEKIYALTCNHLFPIEDIPAYTPDLIEIGTCLFTTRDKGCDFAAIEIKECYSDSCDVAFRREDKKKINANVYSSILKSENIVHKIGATTDVTNGRIVSPEFYFDNRENIFLVKGTAGKFSDQGDSGSLVFSRPNHIQQNYVDVFGMVYASDLTLQDDDDKDDADDQTKIKAILSDGSLEEGDHNIKIYARNKPSSSECDNQVKDNNTASGIHQDRKNISFCCRLHTALDLFKKNQGGNFEVKFKDSVSLSESDDSTEENN